MTPARFFILLFALSPAFLSAQGSLERVKITSDISMKVSTDFLSMSAQQLSDSYASSRAPIAMYSTQDASADLGINQTATRWGASDIAMLKDFYLASINSLYTEVDFRQNEIKNIGERQFIVFEFVGTVVEETSVSKKSLSKYNYIQYTLYNGKVLLFNFNCDMHVMRNWESPVREMMESVRIK